MNTSEPISVVRSWSNGSLLSDEEALHCLHL
jgi:hypothetical protein